MNFIVSSSHLLRHLQSISGVLNTSNTLPILDNFLFDILNGQLTVSASDLETTMITKLAVQSEENGKIAIPAKLILDVLKNLPDQPCTIRSNKETSQIEIAYDNGKSKMIGFNGDEFPKLPSIEYKNSIRLPGDVLIKGINKTLFATGNDGDAKGSASFIIPKKPLTMLKGNLRGDEEVLMEYNEANVVFTFNDIVLVCRLIDGKYPNYEAVIPKENPNVLTVDRQQFLSSIKRVSIFSNKTTYQIKLRLAGSELSLFAEDIDFSNEANERLTCNYDGDDMEIGFNSRFLLEMLNNLDTSEVKLSMSEPSRAGILTPVQQDNESEDVLMLVMPVMLNR